MAGVDIGPTLEATRGRARQSGGWKGHLMTTTTFHGTPREQRDLLRAVSRHCTCEVGPMGTSVGCCPAHRMLVEDQRAVNGLLFGRRLAARLRREEWLTQVPSSIAEMRGLLGAA